MVSDSLISLHPAFTLSEVNERKVDTIPTDPPETIAKDIFANSKTSSELAHSPDTDHVGEGLLAEDFTFNAVKSSNSTIDKTDGKLKKVPEVSGIHTSDVIDRIESEV